MFVVLCFCLVLKAESKSSRSKEHMVFGLHYEVHTVRQRSGIMGRAHFSHRGRANRQRFGLAPASRGKCPSSSGKPLKNQCASDEERWSSGGKNHTCYRGENMCLLMTHAETARQTEGTCARCQPRADEWDYNTAEVTDTTRIQSRGKLGGVPSHMEYIPKGMEIKYLSSISEQECITHTAV